MSEIVLKSPLGPWAEPSRTTKFPLSKGLAEFANAFVLRPTFQQELAAITPQVIEMSRTPGFERTSEFQFGQVARERAGCSKAHEPLANCKADPNSPARSLPPTRFRSPSADGVEWYRFAILANGDAT